VRYAVFTNEVGEDIRYLTRDQPQAEILPGHAYWLFVSRILVRLHFDDEDGSLSGEVIEDPAEIVQHNYWCNGAWHKAVRRSDFAAEQQVGI
jgi:hypothetical protein